ncbi:uncharacterized protein LOC119465025 [Dermacentor silvarum]|uniref:uncharacterized protein LOC119465025 n=1 Tax=Dermacentor silvarum TaxID=543639 RepID=UPI00189A3AA2|nr:uncharacterized protein LOC119465025 [Dermacentor silvarum]
MKQFTESFACFCFLALVRSVTLTEVVDDKKREPIGENVTVQAVIFYDSAYLDRIKKNTESNSDGSNSVENYFKQLFQKVESHFHNHSINITVKVKQVTQKNDFPTYSGLFFSEKEMLENLTKFGQSLGLPQNTIFYRFTWSDKKFMGTGSRPRSESALETDGTFCTSNTSGAVILHHHQSENPWSTIKATAFTFGSKHFFNFSRQDWTTMNQTFLRCPKGEQNLDILAC